MIPTAGNWFGRTTAGLTTGPEGPRRKHALTGAAENMLDLKTSEEEAGRTRTSKTAAKMERMRALEQPDAPKEAVTPRAKKATQ